MPEENVNLEQMPFGTDNFAENPEPRCPLLLLVDNSGSMGGAPIDELNQGLIKLKDELMADSLASKRVEIAIVTFGPVQIVNEFQTVDLFTPPKLESAGDTPMGEAINTGIDLLEKRKTTYKTNGIAYYRPWVMLITDGGPTDSWNSAAERVQKGEANKAFSFFAIAVEGANVEILKRISTARAPLSLKELRFRDLFVWLSRSMTAVSKSNVGDKVALENPTTPAGWAQV